MSAEPASVTNPQRTPRRLQTADWREGNEMNPGRQTTTSIPQLASDRAVAKGGGTKGGRAPR